jgi:hypothetical protein
LPIVKVFFKLFFFPADREPRQMHQNLLDCNFILPDIHQPTKGWRSFHSDQRRSDVQNHLLFRRQSRWLDKAGAFTKRLQNRIPQVFEALHILRPRPDEE